MFKLNIRIYEKFLVVSTFYVRQKKFVCECFYGIFH